MSHHDEAKYPRTKAGDLSCLAGRECVHCPACGVLVPEAAPVSEILEREPAELRTLTLGELSLLHQGLAVIGQENRVAYGQVPEWRILLKKVAAAVETKLKKNCTEACYAMPDCTVCGKRKAPRGRDIAAAAGTDYCTWDCSGYDQEPLPGHMWPNERP